MKKLYYRGRASEYIRRAENAIDGKLEAHFCFVAERDFRLARLKSFQSKRVRAGRILNPTVPEAHGSFVENELVTILGRRITANCDDRGLELEFTVGDQGTVHGLDRKVVWNQSRWWRRQRRKGGEYGLMR